MSIKSEDEESEKPDVVYVKKALKTQQAILFKLSDGTIQSNFIATSNILLITSEDLVLISKDKDVVRERKDNYLDSKNVDLVKSYRIVMEIMNRSKS